MTPTPLAALEEARTRVDGAPTQVSILRDMAQQEVRRKIRSAIGTLQDALESKVASDRVGELRYALSTVSEALEQEARAAAFDVIARGGR